MRDIPVFATENGVASLTLKEIAYKQEAYVRIQDALFPEKLLEECMGFCRAAGAKKIYATGHPVVENHPHHATILKMQCGKDILRETDAALFPVQEKTFEKWRSILNERMANVPNSATVTKADEKQILQKGGAYFVHRGDILLGVGLVEYDTLRAIAGVIPGAGEDVLSALCSAICADTVVLEVADTNLPAVRLYERMGFVAVGAISSWYRVL